MSVRCNDGEPRFNHVGSGADNVGREHAPESMPVRPYGTGTSTRGHGIESLTRLLVRPVHRLSSAGLPLQRTQAFLHHQRRDLQQPTNPRTVHRTIPWSRG